MVLVSGAGTTLGNLCAKIHHKHLNAKITCVVCNRGDAGASTVSEKWGLPHWTLDTRVYPPKDKWDSVFHDLVSVYSPGLIVLAGYNRLVSIPETHRERVVNIHPALLPKYGGKGMIGDKVHEAVLASGEHVTGCTVHLCDHEYDRGRILCQELVPVKPDDTVVTLRKRVQSAERKLFPAAIGEYLDVLMKKNVY